MLTRGKRRHDDKALLLRLLWRDGRDHTADERTRGSVCPYGRPRADAAVEEQVRLAVLALLAAEDVVRADVRDELVVDPDPRRARALGELAVRVEHVEGVVSSGRRLTVVVYD